MSGATGQMVKLAWIRNRDVPAGQPALGTFNCVCGTVITEVEFGGPARTCPGCGQTWDGRGWLVSEPTTTELAAIIEASPRFDDDPVAYFDMLAGKYGRDFTGIAWTQACLKRDQEPSGTLPAGLKATPQGAGLLGWPQGGAS